MQSEFDVMLLIGVLPAEVCLVVLRADVCRANFCVPLFSESLKQAVGHEAIKLLVNVDEDDYEAGRLKLLQNLSE